MATENAGVQKVQINNQIKANTRERERAATTLVSMIYG